MKKLSLFIAVLATASFAFAGDAPAAAAQPKADVKCAMPCCKDAKVSCKDCKTCNPDKAKCAAKCDKPCCKDAKIACKDCKACCTDQAKCAADKAKCNVEKAKCEKPCCKDAKAAPAKVEAKDAPKK